MKTEEMFRGFSVAAGDDRFGEHIKLGGPTGDPIDCKVSAQDTDGAMCIFELTGQCRLAAAPAPRPGRMDLRHRRRDRSSDRQTAVSCACRRVGVHSAEDCPFVGQPQRQAGQSHQRLSARRQDGGVLPRARQIRRQPGVSRGARASPKCSSFLSSTAWIYLARRSAGRKMATSESVEAQSVHAQARRRKVPFFTNHEIHEDHEKEEHYDRSRSRLQFLSCCSCISWFNPPVVCALPFCVK